jgi:hypothetical protein
VIVCQYRLSLVYAFPCVCFCVSVRCDSDLTCCGLGVGMAVQVLLDFDSDLVHEKGHHELQPLHCAAQGRGATSGNPSCPSSILERGSKVSHAAPLLFVVFRQNGDDLAARWRESERCGHGHVDAAALARRLFG